jgi:WD40 repeat protein
VLEDAGKLQNLSLGKNVTDRGLAHLIHCPLRSLHLKECEITDAGLRQLAAIKTLETLVLGPRAKISESALQAFRGTLSGCEVEMPHLPRTVTKEREPEIDPALSGLASNPAKLPGIRRWQMETRWPRGHATAVALSPDGQWIACGTLDGALRILRTETLDLHRIMLGHTQKITSIAWHPDGSHLASSSKDSSVRVWNVDGKLDSSLSGHAGAVNAVAWSPDGKQLITAADDRTVRLWPGAATTSTVLATNEKEFKSLAWHPDGHRLACGLRDGSVLLLSSNGKTEQTCKGHSDVVDCLAWNPDGTSLASNSWDGTVRLWDADGKAGPVIEGQSHKGQPTNVSWSADGCRIAAVTGDYRLMIWRLDRNVEPALELELSHMQNHTWLRDGDQILTFGNLGLQIRRHDGKVVRQVSALKAVHRAAWSPDGMWLAAVGGFAGPRLWRTDGTAEEVVWQNADVSSRLAWSPDGKRLATAGSSKNVTVHELDGSRVRILAHDDYVTSLAWSSIGQYLAAGSRGGNIRIWDVDGWQKVSEFQGHQSACSDLAWNAHDDLLASGGADGSVRSWHSDGRAGPISGSHSGEVYLAWNRDAEWLASTGNTGPIRIWPLDGAPGKPLAGRFVACLAWSPGGNELAWGGGDGSVRQWRTDGVRELMCRAPDKLRCLTWHPSGKWFAGGYPAGIGVWSVHEGEWAWHAKMFEVGAVSFDGSGKFLYGDPDLIERQFVYVVEKAAGRQQTLKPSEFAALKETLTDG